MSENSGYPSMAALLGLLAVAGFQNRDKIAEWFGTNRDAALPGSDLQDGATAPKSQAPTAGPGDIGGAIVGGIGELVERFRQIGRGDAADSWISTGQNQPIERGDLEQAIGQDTIDMLTKKTGLSRDELLSRLQRDLPDTVDRYTPQGRLQPSQI